MHEIIKLQAVFCRNWNDKLPITVGLSPPTQPADASATAWQGRS